MQPTLPLFSIRIQSNQVSTYQTAQPAQMVHPAQVATGGMAMLAPASSPGAMASAAGATLEPQAQPAYTRESIQALLAQRTPGQRLDLRGAYLAGLHLAGLDLSGVDLTGANLTGANLSRCDLREADLTGCELGHAILSKANLREANLMKANLTKAKLNAANLIEATLIDATLIEATLRYTNLRKAKLRGAIFEKATLHRSILAGADLSSAQLKQADMRKANLKNAILAKANLDQARLGSAMLQAADLREASLRGSNLQDADLTQANLTGAFLISSNLKKCRLREATLDQADFTGAEMQRANLSGLTLWQVCFRDAKLKHANLTNTHFIECTLLLAKFNTTQLSGADLTGADLTGADLTEANLSGATLTGATLKFTDMSGTSFQGALFIATLFEDVPIPDYSDMPNKHAFKGALVEGASFKQSYFEGNMDKVQWVRRLSALLKGSKGFPLIHVSSIPESLTPSFPCVCYLPDDGAVSDDALRQRSFEGQMVNGALYKRLQAMNPPHASLPTIKVALTAEEQTRPDVVAAVEQWAADNPERRITLLPNAQGAVDVTHFYSLHRVALDGMALEDIIMTDSQLKTVSEQPNGMMAIMTRYHTYPEAFKNRIQRVCGNGTLWQIWGEIASLPSPQVDDEEKAHINLDMGMGFLSFSPDVATPLPLGYAHPINRSVQNVLSLQTATVIKASEGGKSIEWHFSAPMTLLIGILNQAQGKPKAMVTEWMGRLKALDGSNDPHHEIKSILEITKITAKRKHGDSLRK